MIDTIVNSFDIWTNAQGIKSRTRVKSVDNISLEGISSLRALIIELALRGKLIPQDSTNKPASILLQKIAIEKDKLIADGKIPKQKTLKEIEQYKMPYALPEGWEWAWFSDSYFFQEGPGIRNWQFRSSGIKLLNVQNIVGDKLILDNTDKYIDVDEYQQKYLHFTIEENDLVFASSGGSWGKSAFFHDPGYKVIVNTSTIRMHPYLEDSPRNYLKLFLDSKLFKDQMIEQLVGIQPNFGSTHLFKIFIPVPPSEEQYIIASKVDELMALCDKLEKEQFNNLKTHQVLIKTLLETLTQAADANELQAAWERMSEYFDALFCTEDSIDQLKQTILQLAVMGKLVKQDPNDEPAAELLKKIATEKERLIEEGKIKKQPPLAKITENEQPFALPAGWEFCRLEALSSLITKGSSPKWQGVSYTENPNDVLFITSENVGSYQLLLDSKKYVELKFNEIEPKSILEKGDFLMNIVGGSIGRTAVYNIDDLANINQAVCLIRMFSDYLNEQYFLHFYNSSICISYMFDKQVDNARANLSMGNISKFVIPLPSLSEQKRIAEKVDCLFRLCDLMKEKIYKSQELKVSLSKTIVEKAVQ